MHMGLAQAGARDLYELRFRPELLEVLAAAVPHARLDAAHELMHARGKRTLGRHTALNSLGNQLCLLLLMRLKVAVLAAPLHGADGTHAAVHLIGAALVKDGLARALVGAGE